MVLIVADERAGLPALDAYACLVFTTGSCDKRRLADLGWRGGPLPVPLAATAVTPARDGPSTVADRIARQSYFARRVHDLVLGLEDEQSPHQTRWHRPVASCPPDENGSVVEAWELLFRDDSSWFAVAHVQLGPDPLTALAALTVRRGAGREWLTESLEEAVALTGDRPRLVSHLLWTGDTLPEPFADVAALEALDPWTTAQRWQWFLAAGLTPAEVVPDVGAPDFAVGTVLLSADWRALALRDGVAYVAQTAYRPPAPDVAARPFHEAARAYVRSVHLDTLLLGSLQLSAVHRYADAVAQVHPDQLHAEAVEELESGLLELRTGVWWSNVATRGRQTSDVLLAFQRQHALPELYQQIVQNLTDAARLLQARQARVDEAGRQREEEERRRAEEAREEEKARQQRLQQSVTVVTFGLFPLTVVFAGAALVAEPSVALLVWACAVSVVCIAVTVAALRSIGRRRKYPTPP